MRIADIDREKIMDMLKEYGMSQRDLAEQIGISPTLVSMVLTGRRAPGIKFINGLFEFCRKRGLDFEDYAIVNDSLSVMEFLYDEPAIV